MTKKPTNSLVSCFATGWAALIISEAVYIFVLPHPRGFGGSGAPGTFAIFSLIYSICYAATAAAVLLPFSYLLMRSSRLILQSAAFLGGLVFSTLAYTVCRFWIDFDHSGTILVSVLWFIAGAFAVGRMAFLMQQKSD